MSDTTCKCSKDSCTCSGSCSGSCSCKKDKSTTEQKLCPTCSTPLKGGMKYEDKCTTCEPIWLNRCGGCQRLLYDCMCIHPHRWE